MSVRLPPGVVLRSGDSVTMVVETTCGDGTAEDRLVSYEVHRADARPMEQHPPAQHLVLEVLAARWRLGERTWTFPTSVRRHLVALAEKGLVGWKPGVVERTCLAWLTKAGQREAMWPGYQPPSGRRA